MLLGDGERTRLFIQAVERDVLPVTAIFETVGVTLLGERTLAQNASDLRSVKKAANGLISALLNVHHPAAWSLVDQARFLREGGDFFQPIDVDGLTETLQDIVSNIDLALRLISRKRGNPGDARGRDAVKRLWEAFHDHFQTYKLSAALGSRFFRTAVVILPDRLGISEDAVRHKIDAFRRSL